MNDDEPLDVDEVLGIFALLGLFWLVLEVINS